MKGYMYIARGNNMCGIATENYYPNVSVISQFKQVVQSGSNSVFSSFLVLLHLLLASIVVLVF
jgi:hypothetical protein